ncbi:sensor domain-containing protein [Wenzhouxiangella sediminis]|jgi:diguanylate cyclase (GGDEF)-like protein/PAS domain S-box-containing protein|uniref:cyclic-guanylate-specific phosphodiesterase n=1 Tax=Wenzhouxiangella sediminis TaxID=1792836 RepID=A0A3E1KAI2_9GAMM|nr:bifunctional diguanylate cyclase/phosphodiesterase [Wenzhouxiangella sediminis]RFF31374.1 bifunctional diguanylate cyclase/phosphodiesterase [Wenzhouxiangella sediminis]
MSNGPGSVFENNYSVMLLLDPSDGRIVDANPAAERFYGWSRETLRSMRISEINLLDDAEIRRRMDEARQARRNSFLFRHRTADGSVRDVQVNSGLIDHDGRKLLYSIIQDAGEYLATLRALEKSEHKFQQVIETAPDAIFIHCDLTFGYANHQTARLLGLDNEKSLIGQPVLDYVHPEFRDLARSRISQMTDTGDGAPPVEVDMLHADGSIIHVEVSSVPIEHEGREGILVIARDITLRRKGIQRLRLSATVFENTGEGIIITDHESRIVGVNRAFSRITGYAEQDVLGQNPNLLQSGRQGRSFYRRMWKTLQERGRWQGELWNRRKDGSIYPQLTRINAVSDEQGALTHYVAVITDLSELHSSQRKIERLYYHDLLTGLPNRVMFLDRLKAALGRVSGGRNPVHVLHIDLDGFKHINESLGLQAGDQVLQETARRLQGVLSSHHLVARIGADEFAVLIGGGAPPEAMAESVRSALAEPISINNRVLFATASVGIAACTQAGSDPETLLQQSDAASHQAQSDGGNLVRHYNEELGQYARDRVLLAAQLRQAIEDRELIVHYQPQVDLETGQVVGLEALVRWLHPDLGLLSPERFIPIAEDTGLITDLGELVLDTACGQARAWLDAGIDFGRISVNVSGIQVQRSDLQGTVERILFEHDLPARHLELELTESFIMGTGESAAELLGGLKQLGLCIAMDDFGTGYSSLAYLKELPVDTLKIDQSFTRSLENNQRDAAICQAIVALSQALGFRTLAEGVETRAQRERLQSIGCRFGQGFLFDRAVPPERVPAVIESINARRTTA